MVMKYSVTEGLLRVIKLRPFENSLLMVVAADMSSLLI